MNVSLRAATRDDAADIAALVDISGEGLPRTLWARLTATGQDPLDVGRDLAASDRGPLSWTNATMALMDGQIAGVLMSDFVGEIPAEMTSDTHPVDRPRMRLGNLALRTRSINALATYPKFRRKGVGGRLLALAEEVPGPDGMSMILTDKNAGAQAFCTHYGYHEKQAMPLVHGDWATDSNAWVLMRKP